MAPCQKLSVRFNFIAACERTVVVAASFPACNRPGHSVYRLQGDESLFKLMPLSPASPEEVRYDPRKGETPEVTGCVANSNAVFVGTSRGVWRITAREVARLEALHDTLPAGSLGLLMDVPVFPHPLTMAVDGPGNLWVSAPTRTSEGVWICGFVMSPDHPTWKQRLSSKAPGRLMRHAQKWTAPASAVIGHPTEAGFWAYGLRDNVIPDICFVDTSGVAWSKSADFSPPSLPSVVPPGVRVPVLSRPRVAVDPDGAVLYLAGDTLAGSKVFVFDGKTIEECSPPAELLRARRFTALLCDAESNLHAATDGVGVLVVDGKQWKAHPINEHLPTVIGTELKPVNCMTFDREGNLWVGCDNNVICWQEEE